MITVLAAIDDAEAEREILTQAISAAEGNLSQAARWLGLSRLTLREKLTALGLRPHQRSDSPVQPLKGLQEL